MKAYRNPLTGQRYGSESAAIHAILEDSSDQIAALDVTAKQVMYNSRNKLSLGNKTGKSVISGLPTLWNEKAGRYERFANPDEIAAYRESFLKRMRKVYGKNHILDDPEQQRAMLLNRSIAKSYQFKDGTIRTCIGNEELELLKFLDEVMCWPGYDIQCPAPQTFNYIDTDGRIRMYIPDAFIESLNLIIEVKGPPDHGGWKDKDNDIQHLKDEVLHTSGYEYVKVEDKNYEDLLTAIATAMRSL